MNKYKKENSSLKIKCKCFERANIKLKLKNNLKIKEIGHLRRQLGTIEKKCRQILDRGKQHTKEEKLGRKYMTYKGTNKKPKKDG